MYVGDDRTDIDAFAGLRALVEQGGLGTAAASGSAPTRRRGSSRTPPTRSWTARRGCGSCSRRCCEPPAVRFVDFLKATVILSAGAATRSPSSPCSRPARTPSTLLVFVVAGWWVVAARSAYARAPERDQPSDRAAARGGALHDDAAGAAPGGSSSTGCGRSRSRRCSGSAGAVRAADPGIAAGFAMVWALAWRRQNGAVAAIEDRDGVAFYIEPTSPLSPIKLVRTPGFRRD